MIVDNANARVRRRTRDINNGMGMDNGMGMGVYDPSFLYSAPPGLVEFRKTPYVTTTTPQGSFTSGGSVIYPSGRTPLAPEPLTVFSVYDVPGLLLPYNLCLDEMGGAAGSTACVDRNLAIEAENFRRTAQYNAGTLRLPANPIVAPSARSAPSAPSAPYVAPSITPPSSSQQSQTKQQIYAANKVGSGNVTIGGRDISSIVDQISSPVNIAGFDIPIWVMGIAVVGGLVLVSKMGG